MRLSNRKKAPLYNFLSTLLLIALLIGIMVFVFDRIRFHSLEKSAYLLIIVPIFLLIIMYIRGRQIFEYDSDGETLNFKNRNVIPLIERAESDEFPKYKLKSFQIINGIFFKRLFVTIYSKKGHNVILRYDISYLTKKEINDLKFSLHKVLRNNAAEEEKIIINA